MIDVLQEVLNKYTAQLLAKELEGADEERKREILREITAIKKQGEEEWEKKNRRLAQTIGFAPFPFRFDPRGEAFEEELKTFLHANGPGTGEYAALLTTQEINILGTETTEWETRLLVEFKWWFGERPSEARWQKITIRTYNNLPDKYVYLQVYYTVLAAREKIAERTGVSQDVRY